mgnify:FL=1
MTTIKMMMAHYREKQNRLKFVLISFFFSLSLSFSQIIAKKYCHVESMIYDCLEKCSLFLKRTEIEHALVFFLFFSSLAGKRTNRQVRKQAESEVFLYLSNNFSRPPKIFFLSLSRSLYFSISFYCCFFFNEQLPVYMCVYCLIRK